MCSANARVLVAAGTPAAAGGTPGFGGGLNAMGLMMANTAGRHARTKCPWVPVPLFEVMDDAFALSSR